MGGEVMAYPRRRPARPCALERVPRTTRLGWEETRGAREGQGQEGFVSEVVVCDVESESGEEEGGGTAKST